MAEIGPAGQIGADRTKEISYPGTEISSVGIFAVLIFVLGIPLLRHLREDARGGLVPMESAFVIALAAVLLTIVAWLSFRQRRVFLAGNQVIVSCWQRSKRFSLGDIRDIVLITKPGTRFTPQARFCIRRSRNTELVVYFAPRSQTAFDEFKAAVARAREAGERDVLGW